MNSLSWMIYAAEVCDRLANTAGFISFMFGVMGAFGVIVLWGMALSEDKIIGKLTASILTATFLFIEAFLVAAATLTPSSTTIYMIAASEAGEAVVSTPEAREMLTDLKAIIRKKLKEELGVKDDQTKT